MPKFPVKGYFLRSKSIPADSVTLNIGMETNITITDLVAIRNIMNIAAERGTFKAEEMLEVGTVYTKLNAFLEAVIEKAREQDQSTDTTQPQGE